MVEWIAAAKVKAAFSEGLKSILATGSKDLTGRAVKSLVDPKRAPKANIFAENGPVANAMLPLALNAREKSALSGFLNSELFLSLIRSSSAVALTKDTENKVQYSKLIFHYLYAVLPDTPQTALSIFCQELSELLIDSSAEAWEHACSIGLVNPAEAAAKSAQLLVAGEIANIAAQLTETTQLSLERLREYENFEKRYRKETGSQHGKIRPATLNDAKETPIDKIYVASHLKAHFVQSPDSEPVSREALLKSSFRTVILGTPGGGKSTFASKLCSDLYLKYDDNLYGARALTPVLVVLKDYAKYRKEHPCSIVEFVTLRSKADLQIEPPDGAIRYLFMMGRAVVIFDGLDELLETSDRLDIKLAVEHFANQYPVVPILVTSREVGYEQAPLDKDKFRAFRLEAFNQEQVKEYVSKWFAINKLPGGGRDDSIVRAFMRDSNAVPDLRQNPLMLSLLCSLYKQDGYLPSNRPAVYKRCADLLFETWDKGRDIVVNLPLDRKLRPAMAHLAHWIYSESTLQGGVDESTLVAETARYLSKWCADFEEAQGTAEKFIGFFRGRAWVFSDTGSSRNQPLYQFTHRTFLEFFTAEHLVKSYGSVRDLSRYLLPRLLAREWDVVCQLVYQMCSEMRSASDELVGYLLDDAMQQDVTSQLKLASFLARTLDFIFPTRQARLSAIAYCIDSTIEALKIPEQDGMTSDGESLGGEILEALMTCSVDMLDLHKTEFCDRIISYVNSSDSASSRANVLVCVDNFDATIEYPLEPQLNMHTKAWRETEEKIREATLSTRLRLVVSSPQLAISSWWERKLDVTELVAFHGVRMVFEGVRSPLQQWWRVGIADSIVNQGLNPDRQQDSYLLHQGRKIPPMLLAAPYPWFDRSAPPVTYWNWRAGSPAWPEDKEIRELTLLVVAAGGLPKLQSTTEFATDVSTIVAAREKASLREEARRIIDRLDVGDATAGFMASWIDDVG
jgi:hypothetical protein